MAPGIRIGFGYDVHQLAAGRKLILGGIDIPHNKGCIAHSDGDVLVHAICDALLGAAALRDIGFHFPDNSDEYKNISSLILLKKTVDLLTENKYSIGNIDTTICLQQPKLQSYIPQMADKIAGIVNIPASKVSVKATTTEKMGFVGEEKGISVYAIVLIHQ